MPPWPGLAPCESYLPANLVSRFTGVLEKVAVGDDCEICGWFVRDNTTSLHYLRPLTSIDPYPDTK